MESSCYNKLKYFSIIIKAVQHSMKVVGKKHSKEYTLKDVLGQGSFGKVYYSPPYAVKEMNFQGLPRSTVTILMNQVAILDKIKHPNIVRLVDHFSEGDCVYLVLEYCEMDLAKYMKKHEINEKTALYILRHVLQGFKELVDNNIIHRDLKPANILVNSKGEFKLADFGFAKIVDQYEHKMLNSIVGTPLYMAPQILGKTQYTTKSDIWSLGFIYYELLTKKTPWTGMSEADLYRNIKNKPLVLPANISTFSKDLLTRMLTINQKDRIGWDELFKEVLSANRSPEKARNQPISQRRIEEQKENQSPTKARPRIFTPEKRAASNKKIGDVQQRQNIVVLEKAKHLVPPEVVREIFLLEYERKFGEDECRKLSSGRYQGLGGKQKDQFQGTLRNFNNEFQRAVKSIFQAG